MKHVLFNWNTAINMGVKNPDQEAVDPVSLTIPGMTLSLEELVRKYTRTGDISAHVFTPSYTDDDAIPDGIEHMDELARREMLQDLRENINDFQQGINERKKRTPPKTHEVDPGEGQPQSDTDTPATP